MVKNVRTNRCSSKFALPRSPLVVSPEAYHKSANVWLKYVSRAATVGPGTHTTMALFPGYVALFLVTMDCVHLTPFSTRRFKSFLSPD
jgi:hypothetical protein